MGKSVNESFMYKKRHTYLKRMPIFKIESFREVSKIVLKQYIIIASKDLLEVREGPKDSGRAKQNSQGTAKAAYKDIFH